MNKTKYMQTDSRWGNLGYPKAPCYLRNCGCGEVSIANVIIEMEKYKDYTPKTILSYCRQFAASNCDGTFWSGIPKMMEHYGLADVKECATMPELWNELERGNRVAIYLMGSRRGGSKGVHWTSGGHFVASVDYKVKDGKHYVYVKDSYSNSNSRNGWISYEDNMKGDVIKVWCGRLTPSKVYKPSTPYKGKLPKGEVRYNDEGDDVKRLQTFLNWCMGTKLNCKGRFHKKTLKYLMDYQEQYGLETDGIWGKECKKKAKEIIAKYAPKEEKPKEKSIADKTLDACKEQAEWMKDYKYGWESKPTIPKSKKKGTCVTYVACVLQRLGYLKPGQALWHNGRGYGDGKVTGATDDMQVIYMNNKTLKSLKDKLKAGDIVMVDDNKSGVKGSGGHIFILTGKWTDAGSPYIYDNQSANRVKAGKNGKHTYGSGRKVLAVVRLKEKKK